MGVITLAPTNIFSVFRQTNILPGVPVQFMLAKLEESFFIVMGPEERCVRVHLSKVRMLFSISARVFLRERALKCLCLGQVQKERKDILFSKEKQT